MTTASLFETLDRYEARFVADFMSRFSRIIIRATCLYGKEMIAIPEKMTFMNMIRKVASDGHRDLCVLAREWGMSKKFSDFNGTGFDVMLECAAGGEDFVRARDLCILAEEWGATNFRGMLTNATIRGNRDLCDLAYAWSAHSNSVLDLDAMLMHAVEEGHRDLCIIATDWIDALCNDDYLNEMLATAARCGNRDLCVLAKEWIDARGIKNGADLGWMIRAADCCEDHARGWAIKQLAREWMDARLR